MAASFERADWTNVLMGVPLFAGLPKRHVKAIAKTGRIQMWDVRTPIVQKGGKGDSFFVILEGSAKARPPGRKAVTLGVGDYFGELALLAESPRTATVDAAEPTMTLRLSRTDFLKFLSHEPKVGLRLLQTLAVRLSQVEKPAAG